MNEIPEKGIPMTDFDYLLADPQTQMMKAAIPYMHHSQQRMFSMMIKMQELRRTMNMFQEGELSAMGIASEPDKKLSPLEMLQVMKPYAGPKEREMIDMFENIQLMMQAMQTNI